VNLIFVNCCCRRGISFGELTRIPSAAIIKSADVVVPSSNFRVFLETSTEVTLVAVFM